MCDGGLIHSGLDGTTVARIRIKRNSKYYSIHTHSRYSYNDALPDIKDLVEKASRLGYPALGLTDHGNMAGTVQLYQECRKKGIKPMPGSELYLVRDRTDKKAKRYHIGMVAYTTQGYRNLVHISTRSHKQFHHKPLLDLADLADLHEQGKTEGIALTTGCFFGLVTQTLISDGYTACKNLVAVLASWFDTYVEIQMHDIDHGEGVPSEYVLGRLLHRIAGELDLPVVITQDSHYLDEEHKELHDTLKALVSWSEEVDSAQFPGDSFHLADEQWMRDHHTDEIYNAGIEGLQHLLSKYDMYVEEMEEYHYKVPQIYPDPDIALRDYCFTVLSGLGLPKKYKIQLEEELDVIAVAGMANYMLMVREVCSWMLEEEIFYQVRGSAAGSLVCWLLGISNVDPLKWKLRFDRFLSKDRTKPPDIDIDVEHARRKDLLDYIAQRFTMVQICNWGTYSFDEDKDKGSLKVKYLAKQRKMGLEPTWVNAPQEDKDRVIALAGLKLISNPGVHAAGVVVTSSQDQMDAMVPMQWIPSSRTMVSQYDGPDIEKIGLVKLDALGVKTMTVIRLAIENLGMTLNMLYEIPLNDRKVYSLISSGRTEGMFQLEGDTTRKMISRLKPRKIGDVIAAMALFRPGVMKSGAMDSYLRRNNRQEALPERHPIIAAATNETKGILLYQDQVISILRTMGMDADNLTAFLKAVKASNKGVEEAQRVMDHYMPIIQKMCHEHGMNDDDIKWLSESFDAFAEYSFNRAHATVYGITAYWSAYLSLYHPLEFCAALLAVGTGSDKEFTYKHVTRRNGIRITSPDVNVSKSDYTVDKDKKVIRKGLRSIKGVGVVASREIEAKQPFTDFTDFITRCDPGKVTGIKAYLKTGIPDVGVLCTLYEAGALKSLKGVEHETAGV